MPPDYVFAHVGFNLAAIRAVGTLEARQKAALVSEMPGQISFPIEGLVAIGIRTTVDPALSPLLILLSRIRPTQCSHEQV